LKKAPERGYKFRPPVPCGAAGAPFLWFTLFGRAKRGSRRLGAKPQGLCLIQLSFEIIRWNGSAFSSLTGKAGGLPNYTITASLFSVEPGSA